MKPHGVRIRSSWKARLSPLLVVTACTAPGADAQQFLRRSEAPHFAAGHRLPPLALWREMSYDVMTELAQHWGYGLYLDATPGVVAGLEDPDSETSRIIELLNAEPDRYLLTVRLAPARDLRQSWIRLDDLPDRTFYRDAHGNLVDDERHVSPLAPDEAMLRIADYLAELVRAIRQHAPIAVVINGGEYGFEKPQRVPLEIALRDPRVRETWERDGRPWIEFMSDHKARHERIVRAAIRDAAPEALYIHYSEVGGGHPRRMMTPDWEGSDFLYRPGVSDLAASRHYFMHGNSGFTGSRDILSQLLNSRAQEIAAGATHAYFWLSSGWSTRGHFADHDRYEGFVKSAYVAGSIGAVAAYFGNRADRDPVEESLPQFLILGRVHALFSHVDGLLLDSDLLPGPDRHRWSRDLPAYELPTGHRHARVLVRRQNAEPVWLISAWAADGRPRTVRVDVPGLGVVRLRAEARGNVYVMARQEDGGIRRRMLEAYGSDR
jgi:hypothetical protein